MDAPYLEQNPFFVLELPVDCAPMEIERAGQKLLAMMQVGMTSAVTYRTPLGTRTRDESAVRTAVAALHDPRARAIAAFWARPEVWEAPPATPRLVWRDAHKRLGTLDR